MDESTSKGFFQGTTLALRIAFFGFLIVAIGVGLGFLGFAIRFRVVSIVGYGLSVAGGVICFTGIAYGWVRYGPEIVKNVYIHYIKKAR